MLIWYILDFKFDLLSYYDIEHLQYDRVPLGCIEQLWYQFHQL
jgi:hypothetical protein